MEKAPLNLPSSWVPEDLEADKSWIHHLSASEIADLDAALATAKTRGRTCATLTREDFPLNGLAATQEKLLAELEDGRGVFIVRGFPAERYSKEDLRLLYWGLGLNLGTAVSQSNKGDVLGDVRNFGNDVDPARYRGYMSGKQLAFHTDTADVVCLFVMQTAKSGGRSIFCSSIAIHDEIARTHADLLDVLYQPFYWSWMGQERERESRYYTQPIYSYHAGKFSSRFLPYHIRAAQEFPEVPRLTDLQRAAIELIERLTNEPRFQFGMMFQAGDFQFLNNHVIYHARTAFEDYSEPERKRHLLRMWLAVANSRELSPAMSAIFRDQSAGALRGGFPSKNPEPVYETKVSEF